VNPAAATDALEAGRTIEAAGLRTHFHEAGEGPALLLLHGSGPGVSAWANWSPIIGDLAQSFYVIAPDQVGFGGTQSRPDGRYGRAVWTEHALALLDTLGLERVSVIGNSMGGAIALSLAASRPEAIERIVLMGALGVRFPLPDGLDRVWGYTPDHVARMRELIGLFAYNPSIVTDDLVSMRYEQSLDPERRASYEAMFPAPRQRWLDDLALDEDALASITQPTLLVHGFNDVVVPKDSTLRLMEVLPNADAHLIGRCGHWVQIEQTQKFMDIVRGFLAAGRGRGTSTLKKENGTW
jgi:2-hydroxymuconate-semialdehyde hydrolase